MSVWRPLVRLTESDCSSEMERLFASFLLLSTAVGGAALYGCVPPDPAVHWPGHSWIHFMKRLHVIMSIGSFLIELCAFFFALFALHRVLVGGFDSRARSTAQLIVRELEFEYVAVCSYFFAGAWLIMGPVAIRCFCMVQQGLRSYSLAAACCSLIIGAFLLILSFFNAHLVSFPYDSYDELILRFMQLSFTRCQDGGRAAIITTLAWVLQAFSVLLACARPPLSSSPLLHLRLSGCRLAHDRAYSRSRHCRLWYGASHTMTMHAAALATAGFSLIETFPWNYYRDVEPGVPDPSSVRSSRAQPTPAAPCLPCSPWRAVHAV